jgi:RNA polymerase sigma factor (sigma-70 family)
MGQQMTENAVYFCRPAFRLRFRFSPANRILYMRAISGGCGRMGDVDQQQAAESSAAAVAQLFREHNRVLVRYLSVRLQSIQEANEVAQESYARLLQLQQPGSASQLRAYLFKIATNLAIDRLRHRNIRRRAEEQPALWSELIEAPDDFSDPAEQLSAREQAERLLGFLQELPGKCQRVFDLHRLEGMPQEAVAERLGFSQRMVRRYVTYAMVYCHLRLQGLTIDQARREVSL